MFFNHLWIGYEYETFAESNIQNISQEICTEIFQKQRKTKDKIIDNKKS